MCVCVCVCVCVWRVCVRKFAESNSFYLFHQISTRTDLLGEDGLSDANQKGVDSYVNFWTGRDVLYVYFLNPDILEQEKWECEYGVLNIDNILSWAEAWNPKKFPNIPIFKKTDRADKADIRVKFTGTKI